MEDRNRLFLTYAWIDDEGGDFTFIVQLLTDAGLGVQFDKVSLVGGRPLWPQLAARITDPNLDAWGMLVTRSSLESNACMEEYDIALNRAIGSRGRQFPLIALAHGVRFEDLPPNLRIRLGVSTSDPHLAERVVAAVEGRFPQIPTPTLSPIFVAWRRIGNMKVLEVRPRLGQMAAWRVAFSTQHQTSFVRFAEGPSGGPEEAMVKQGGVSDVRGDYYVVGANGPIGDRLSAYLYFRGNTPGEVLVGEEGKESWYRVPVPPSHASLI
jgi:hypothetical protein